MKYRRENRKYARQQMAKFQERLKSHKRSHLGGPQARVISTTVISEPKNRRAGYHNFLKSDHWKDLRRRKLRKHGSCFICLTRNNLQIHHVSYKNAYNGNAKKAIKDTHVLCGGCHNAVHAIQRSKGVGYEATEVIIQGLKMEAKKTRDEVREYNESFNEMLKNIL